MFCTNCGEAAEGAFCAHCGSETSAGARSNIESPEAIVTHSSQLDARVSKSNVRIWVGLGLVVVVVFAIAAVTLAMPRNPFPTALQSCGLSEDGDYIFLSDGGRTMILDGEGDESYGAANNQIDCVLEELDLPASVLEKMGNTSALLGVVTDSWDGIDAEWTYHPDEGFDVILTWSK